MQSTLFDFLLLSAPHRGHQEYEQGHDLKPAEQHDGAHHELADAGEEAEVTRRPHRAKARAHVADGRE